MSNFYSGSYILSPLAPVTGLSVDKLNFIVGQLVSIAAGWSFRNFLPAKLGSNNLNRYVSAAVLGFALSIFCFGHQVIHLLLQGIGCFLLMNYWPQSSARFAVCIFAMLYLSVCHLLRMYYDYGGYTMDITGPLMIQTQRLSSLAFNVYDGEMVASGNDKQLTPGMKRHFVARKPSPLQYLSYMLHFQGVLVGPFVFYSDFSDFMEGRPPPGTDVNQLAQHSGAGSRMLTVAKWVLAFTAATLILPAYFPIEYLATKEFASHWLATKLAYLTVACFIVRQKYYFAWSMGELCYLGSGCGFSGVNEKTGEPEYRLVQNFRFTDIELATSMKVAFDNWNIGTATWLRECIYDRVPAKHGTLLVFVASAFWHGFYPGYYLTFVSAAFFTSVARLCRRSLRHQFQQSPALKLAYDICTGVSAITALNYIATAFSLLDIFSVLQFWRSVYFLVHVAAAALMLILSIAGGGRGGGSGRGRAGEAAASSASAAQHAEATKAE